MFTTNSFNDNFSNSFALLQKMPIFDGIFDGVLMVFLPQLSVASLLSRQKLCGLKLKFLWCLFSSLKLLIDFCLNV